MHYNEVKGGKVFVEALPLLLFLGLMAKAHSIIGV
jgi:hypothetical protein